MSGGEYTGRYYAAVTLSDSTSLLRSGQPPIALFVGTAGNLALKSAPGETAVVFKNVPAGTTLPVAATHAMSTNTTAADIVAIYERP